MNDVPTGIFDARSAQLISRGVSEFNTGKFFECHDTLEEVWQAARGQARDFLQGLIQISVGLYHLCNGNLTGAASQMEKGLARLEPYGDQYAGVDLAGLKLETMYWLDRIEGGAAVQGRVSDLPKIRLVTAS